MPEQKKDLIAVCTPSRGIVSTTWSHHQFAFIPPKGAELTPLNVEENDVTVGRLKLLRNAREIGATHIMWLDADTFINRTAIARLYSHGFDIVSGVCASRQTGLPCVYVWHEGQYHHLTTEQVAEEKVMADERIAAGMACCLVKMSVFDKLPKLPFMYGWLDPELKGFTSEDLYFMSIARKAGFIIHVDTGVKAVHSDTSIVKWNGERAHMDPNTLWAWLDPTGANSPGALPSNEDLKKTRESMEPQATQAKAGRNEPCPCGSGKKYKKCCLAGAAEGQ